MSGSIAHLPGRQSAGKNNKNCFQAIRARIQKSRAWEEYHRKNGSWKKRVLSRLVTVSIFSITILVTLHDCICPTSWGVIPGIFSLIAMWLLYLFTTMFTRESMAFYFCTAIRTFFHFWVSLCGSFLYVLIVSHYIIIHRL
jgi:hypothetical protein